MWWAAILHPQDDDVDLLHHCNVFKSLSSVAGFPSLKEHVFKKILFNGCFQI